MSPIERSLLEKESAHRGLQYDSMYERMIERLYLTSFTRCIPRYTLEAARLRHWVITHNEQDPNQAPET